MSRFAVRSKPKSRRDLALAAVVILATVLGESASATPAPPSTSTEPTTPAPPESHTFVVPPTPQGVRGPLLDLSDDPAIRESSRRLTSVADSIAIDAPVLWSTRLLGIDTTPLAGISAVAYIQDQKSTPGSRKQGDPGIIPIARTTSGTDGTITFRLDPATVNTHQIATAWTNVFYVFSSGEDFAMWGDSVVFAPNPDAPEVPSQGRWITSLIEQDRLAEHQTLESHSSDRAASTEAVQFGINSEEQAERPSVVTLPFTPRLAEASASAVVGATTSIPLETGCTVSKRYPNTLTGVTVGTIYLSENWTSTFVYKDHTTTQIQGTVSASVNFPIGGSTGLTFGAGSSFIVSESVSGTSGQAAVAVATLAGQTKIHRIRPIFEFINEEWKCTSTYPNSTPKYKLMTWAWRARMDKRRADSLTGTFPACNTKSLLIGSTYSHSRTSSSSNTDFGTEWSIGASASAAGVGYGGQSSTTFLRQTDQFWVNNSTKSRYLCFSGGIDGLATVVATTIEEASGK